MYYMTPATGEPPVKVTPKEVQKISKTISIPLAIQAFETALTNKKNKRRVMQAASKAITLIYQEKALFPHIDTIKRIAPYIIKKHPLYSRVQTTILIHKDKPTGISETEFKRQRKLAVAGFSIRQPTNS